MVVFLRLLIKVKLYYFIFLSVYLLTINKGMPIIRNMERQTSNQTRQPMNILNNEAFLEACQLEAIGQLKEKGITEQDILENPDMFAKKVFEVAELFKEVKEAL